MNSLSALCYGTMLRVRPVLGSPVAVNVWLALTVVGVVVGWLTVEPWWAVGGFAVGGIVAVVTAWR